MKAFAEFGICRWRVLALLLIAGLCSAQTVSVPKNADAGVQRFTLSNGLRVVIIPNNLAPVVTVQENYLVGGDETPAGFPGMAHAQEHRKWIFLALPVRNPSAWRKSRNW